MAAPPTRRPRRAVTGRALVLGAVVVVLLMLLASPLSRYFHSRSDLAAARDQLSSDQRQLTELTKLDKMWSDPGFVQEQARARLQFAMPGDTVYVVVDKGAKSDIEKSARPEVATGPFGSWNTRIWTSVERASK